MAGQKVPANTIAYYNKHFLRGKPKQLKNMNGGKTKFVSAREKRVRAQLKRERDREQAVLVVTQQQQHQQHQQQQQQRLGGIYQGTARRAGTSASAADSLAGLMGDTSTGAMGATTSAGLFGSIPSTAASLLGGASSNNPAALQALLASRQMLFQRQADEIRYAEHVLSAEFTAQKQREELQMRLLQQRGGAITDSATSNSFLRGVFHHPSQLQGTNAVSTTGAVGNLASVEQLLAARQQLAIANGTTQPLSGSLIDRLLAQRMSMNSRAPDTFLQPPQRLEQHGSRHRLQDDASQQNEAKGGWSAPKPHSANPIDPELFKLYLLEQERKRQGL